MNSRSNTGPGDCLTNQLMADYLEGGGLTPVVKAACEVHLIACDHCRENLAAFMRVLQPEITPQENNAIEEVLAKWERKDSRPTPLPRPFSRWKKALTYGAIASVLALVAFMGGRGFRASPDELVHAMTKFRPFEARLSNQPHFAFTAKRAPGEEPDFEALRKELARRSADSYQLGRFELLAGKYDEAVEQLEAAASERRTAEVRNDLGVAYFNRNRNGDLRLARENLEAAIELDNTFEPAVFNLVLLNEVEGLTADANQKIINRYLELDPDSDWAKELSNRISRQDR